MKVTSTHTCYGTFRKSLSSLSEVPHTHDVELAQLD